MKKIYTLLIIILMIMTACQPTPETEVVISKDDGVFEQALEATAIPTDDLSSTEAVTEEYSYEYPESFKAYYEKYDGRLIVDIDAEIVVSEADNYPVCTIKPYYIPIEQANKIVEAIFGTLDVYNIIYEIPKEQVEELIIETKAEIQTAENCENEVDYLEEYLEYLYTYLETAPDEVTVIKYNGEYIFSSENGYEKQYIELRKNPYNLKTPALQIYNIFESAYGNGYDSIVTYEYAGRDVYNYVDENTNKMDFDENPIFNTDEAKEAIEIANQFLTDIGIDDRILEHMIARSSDSSLSDISGYVMYYGKEYNDTIIPLFVNIGGTVTLSEDDYIEPFTPESLKIEVSNGEIIYFEWVNMYEIDTSLNDNIELMPFEEIMENVETQLSVKYAYLEDGEIPYDIYIDEIILTYAVEPIKDSDYEYMILPVWAFYGGYDYGEEGYELSDGTILTGRYDEQACLLTINAVDGTVISLN